MEYKVAEVSEIEFEAIKKAEKLMKDAVSVRQTRGLPVG